MNIRTKIKLGWKLFQLWRLIPIRFTDKTKITWYAIQLYKQWEKMGMKAFLFSKKANGLLVGLVTVVLVNVVGLPPEQVSHAVDAIMALVSAYLIAQGAADLGKGKITEEKKLNGK